MTQLELLEKIESEIGELEENATPEGLDPQHRNFDMHIGRIKAYLEVAISQVKEQDDE